MLGVWGVFFLFFSLFFLVLLVLLVLLVFLVFLVLVLVLFLVLADSFEMSSNKAVLGFPKKVNDDYKQQQQQTCEVSAISTSA